MSTPIETTGLLHLALDDRGLVLAHFMLSEDCADYCSRLNYLHLPWNAKYVPPALGARYDAGLQAERAFCTPGAYEQTIGRVQRANPSTPSPPTTPPVPKINRD